MMYSPLEIKETVDMFMRHKLDVLREHCQKLGRNPADIHKTVLGSLNLSRDGARVAYRSRASNLVPGQDDTNFAHDVFLYDTALGSNALASHRPGQAAKTGGAEASNTERMDHQ